MSKFGFGRPNPGFGFPNPGFGHPNPAFGNQILDLEIQIQDLDVRTQDLDVQIKDLRNQIHDIKFRIWTAESRIWTFKCWIWTSHPVFGHQNLEFDRQIQNLAAQSVQAVVTTTIPRSSKPARFRTWLHNLAYPILAKRPMGTAQGRGKLERGCGGLRRFLGLSMPIFNLSNFVPGGPTQCGPTLWYNSLSH